MRALLVVVLILASARWSTAEINMADSIEWTTADSDRVAVVQVASRTEGAGWWRVTFAVREMLKGPTAPTLEVIVRGDAPRQWKGELLVFLVDARRRAVRDGECQVGAACSSVYLQTPWAVRPGRWGEGDVLALDGSARAFTVAHDVIGKRAELIAKVKASAGSKATEAFQLDLPLDSPAGQALYGGSAVWLYIPVDAALEQAALGWIAAKQPHLRDQGVAALAHFKSAANIRRLEALLADPATHEITDGSRRTLRYFVRKRAHEALVAWRVPHTTPVIER